MYFYSIGYGSYEDSSFIEYVFSDKLTDEELERYVHKAVIAALEKVIAMADTDDYLYYDSSGPTFRTIQDLVHEELLNLGFNKLEYDAEWGCFGWASIIDKDDWSNDRDDKLNRLSDAIPQNLKDAIIQNTRSISE